MPNYVAHWKYRMTPIETAVQNIVTQFVAILAAISLPTDTSTPPPTSTSYYFNSTFGNDGNDCKSAANACKTIAKAMSLKYGGGDKLLFAGTFSGNVTITPRTVPSLGDSRFPIIVGSLDPNNRATITARTGGETGIVQISGVSGVTVTDLILRGPTGTGTPQTMPRGGVMIQNPSAVPIRGITVRNSDIGGISWFDASRPPGDPNGRGDWGGNIFIEGSPGKPTGGIHEVLIENNDIHGLDGPTSHDDTGIGTFGGQPMTGFIIRNNRVWDIGGGPAGMNPGRAYAPLGSGILSPDGANHLIEYNIVHDVGGNMSACGGPAGIMAGSVDNLIIQFNEVYRVQPVNYVEGCDWIAIDFDSQTTNSIMQYNYTHDNFNSGYYLFHTGIGVWGNNTIRYNISENDNTAGMPGFGAIGISLSTNSKVYIYNNTVFNNLTTYNGGKWGNFKQGAYGISIADGGNVDGLIANNLFIQLSRGNEHQCLGFYGRENPPGYNPLVAITNNHFYCAGDGPWINFWKNNVYWGTSDFSGIAAASGKFQNTTLGDPMITSGGTDPNGYVLQRGSPMIGSGLDYHTLAPNPPTADYFGNPIPSAAGYNRGADGAPHP
jgi:hypothetical protein